MYDLKFSSYAPKNTVYKRKNDLSEKDCDACAEE